jgi:cytidylate kinase
MYSRGSMTDKLAPFVRAAAQPRSHDPRLDQPPRGTLPFVTIMRSAGAAGSTMAYELARLLQKRDPAFGWEAFDRELVERVAEDHQISAPLVESLEEKSRNWIDKLLVSGAESDFGVYRRVAGTIRALAEVGGAILVGRGAVFITRDLPGGIHVRLVAPVADRVQYLVKKRGITEREAEEFVRDTDVARAEFYRRWWPGVPIGAEMFHATFNIARIPPEAVARCLVTLIPSPGTRAGSRRP